MSQATSQASIANQTTQGLNGETLTIIAALVIAALLIWKLKGR